MDTPLHYTKSPLTEAVLDLRVQLPASITADSWQALYCKIKDVYPEQRERLYMEGEIEFGPEIRSSGKQTVEGYEFISKDKKQYIYVGLNGFSFNRLAPYQTWDEFRDEARRLWMLYREFANPERVVRMAVRYINRLDIPLPFTDLKEFLRVGPEVPSDFPNGALVGSFMQLVMPQPDLDSTLILTQALPSPDNMPLIHQGVISVILDIDLFREQNIPDDEQSVWAIFEQFRIRKNQVFYSSITDLMREVIK